jgi:hypothetical protein
VRERERESERERERARERREEKWMGFERHYMWEGGRRFFRL